MAHHDHDTSKQALYLLEQHEKKLMTDAEFLKEFGKVTVYHSTPYGDHIDGKPRLFLIPAPEKTAYLPVFTSEERAQEFFTKAGRAGYLLMSPTFHEALITARKANETVPIKMGLIVDPGYYGITVDVPNLDIVISMTE